VDSGADSVVSPQMFLKYFTQPTNSVPPTSAPAGQ
jgi:hypothetical protein